MTTTATTNNFADIFSLLAEETQKNYDQAKETKAIAKEEALDKLLNNTTIYALSVSKGFVGFRSADFQGNFGTPVVKPAVFSNGVSMTNPQGVFAGLHLIAKDILENVKTDYVVISMQESERPRAARVLMVAKGDTQDLLTEGQMKFINSHRAYGKNYIGVANALPPVYKAVREAGKTVQLLSNNEISVRDLTATLDGDLASDGPITARFANNVSAIEIGGELKKISIKKYSSMERVYGDYELVSSNGILKARKVHPQQSKEALAQALLANVNSLIDKAYSENLKKVSAPAEEAEVA